MSRMTKEINRISLMVISLSAKLIFYTTVVVLLILGVRKGYAFGYSIFYSPAMEAAPGTAKEIVLTGDETVAEVGEALEEAGLIRDKNAFVVQALCYEYEVKPGTYSLSTAQSSKEIIDILQAGAQEETSGAVTGLTREDFL